MSRAALRVLHVLGELRPSGAESMLVGAASAFARQGITAEVLSTGAQAGPYAPQFSAAGFGVHHLPFARSPAFFGRVRRLFRTGAYDAIHLHCEAANFWYGLAALSSRPGAVVQTIHNAFEFEGLLRLRRGWQRRAIRRLGVRHVAISASVQDNEARRFGLDTILIPNWYDSERYVATSEAARASARQALGIDPRQRVLATVGNCAAVKNHAALIEAIAQLPPAERPICLHAGIEESGEPERTLARQLGVDDRIRFLGGGSSIPAVLQAADAFVMCSLREGMGIAALEALATGLPALFTDVPGLRDFRDQFPGLIYSGADSAALASGLRRLLALTAEERARCRQDYPQRAAALYDVERGVAAYCRLYRA